MVEEAGGMGVADSDRVGTDQVSHSNAGWVQLGMARLLRSEAGTNRGLVRSNNEDNYLNRSEIGLFIVCDGLGGHAAGEIASQLAVDTIRSRIEGVGDPERQLSEAINEANRKILRDQQTHPERIGMGTTLSALWLADPKGEIGWIGHIGDSRVYRCREDQLDQLTEDHSPVYRLYKEGSLDKDQLRHHPQKNLIERSLGLGPTIQCDIFTIDLQPGDRFLLCTDGLSDCVSDEEIREVCRTTSLDQLCPTLIQKAIDFGGYDNITIVVVELADS